MRITGGTLRGRNLVVPRRGMRPTQDRVRQALFSILAAGVPNCSFLDLYAGCGSVGLEAWSRGANAVFWVESGRIAFDCLRRNVEDLGGDVSRCVRADVDRFLASDRVARPFDFIFADPPYGSKGWLSEVLHCVQERAILLPGGCFILEESIRSDIVIPCGWRVVTDRTFGETRVILMRGDPDQTTGGTKAT